MSAQVTEAHLELAKTVIFSRDSVGRLLTAPMGAQLIADSEAKACAELRGALALGQQNCDDVFEDLRNERDKLRAELARLDTEKPWLKEANATVAKLRAEVERLRDGLRDSEAALALNTLRAERAEAKLNESRYETVKAAQEGLRECIRAERAETELATERARLDYMSNCGFEHLHNETGDHLGHEWTISGYGESRDVTLRDVIDAEMEEGRK